MKIVLAWPDKRLTPNAKRRLHWTAQRQPIKAAREEAYFATKLALGPAGEWCPVDLAEDAPVALTATFYPPDNRRRDRDGMQSSLKHALDGIADALGVDDYRFRITYQFEAPCKPGRVEVEL